MYKIHTPFPLGPSTTPLGSKHRSVAYFARPKPSLSTEDQLVSNNSIRLSLSTTCFEATPLAMDQAVNHG